MTICWLEIGTNIRRCDSINIEYAERVMILIVDCCLWIACITDVIYALCKLIKSMLYALITESSIKLPTCKPYIMNKVMVVWNRLKFDMWVWHTHTHSLTRGENTGLKSNRTINNKTYSRLEFNRHVRLIQFHWKGMPFKTCSLFKSAFSHMP